MCGNNGKKLTALEFSMVEVFKKAEGEVKKWKERFKDKKRKYDKETLKRGTMDFYGKLINWSDWESSIGEIKDDYAFGGLPLSEEAGSSSKKAVMVLKNPDEWKKKIGMTGVDLTPFDDIETAV